MKYTEFNSLVTYNTLAQVALLATDTKFFFASAAGYRLTPDVMGKQASNTALRHKIQYCVKDTSSTGYHTVMDILERDDAANQTKTLTRKNQTETSVTRDDDNARDAIGKGSWS